MPRGKGPSFELKTLIWEAAAQLGKDKLAAIRRQVDVRLSQRRRSGEVSPDDETPEERTIQRIVAELKELRPEVVLDLPRSIWTLRADYEELMRMSERAAVVQEIEALQLHSEERRNHREKLTAVLNTLLMNDLLYVERMASTDTGNPIYLEIRGEPGREFTLPQLHRQLEENLAVACREYVNTFVFKCFLPHLQAEYPNVKFRMLSKIETDDPYQLLQALQAIDHRGTFKGSCPICEDFK